MKRFYKNVSVHQLESGGYGLSLDAKPVKTSAGHVIECANEKIVSVVAKEWDEQREDINPATMPMTQILSTIIDTDDSMRAEMSARILPYIDTDLLCYRTNQPSELKDRQEEVWGQPLSWFHAEYGYEFITTYDLVALKQPQPIHDVFTKALSGFDQTAFGVFQITTSITGSIILALAFVKKAMTAEQVYNAVFVDEFYRGEIYDEKKYGVDPMQEKQRHTTLQDLTAMELLVHSSL